MRISGVIVLRFLIIIALVLFCVSVIRAQTILQPNQDVLIITFGGGEGCNVFVKYNITSVPSAMQIDSVFITPYIISFGGGWDGDAHFWNVNDQDWTEGDSCNHIYGLPTSNQVTQASGFGTTPGWDQSVDLTDIFLVDYNASHTYCSIKIKDPDDMTSVPMPGSMPVNAETLAVGNIIFGEYTVFYAREYPNAPPWLVVYYHSVGIEEEEENSHNMMITVAPNPTSERVHISLAPGIGQSDGMVSVYDVNGVQVKKLAHHAGNANSVIVWNGRDEYNRLVPSGTYFCVVTGEGYRIVEPVCIIR
jgi:hypothetical protein